MDDTIDESGGACGVGEDGGPIAKCEVGGEDEAPLFVAMTDDLEQEVGVSVVEGEKSDLIDGEKADASVALETALESASGFLGGEIEQELSVAAHVRRWAFARDDRRPSQVRQGIVTSGVGAGRTGGSARPVPGGSEWDLLAVELVLVDVEEAEDFLEFGTKLQRGAA